MGRSVQLTTLFFLGKFEQEVNQYIMKILSLVTDIGQQPFLNESASDFIWDLRKLPFPSHLGKKIIKIEKISAKIHVIGKIKAIFGLGRTPI